MLDLYFFFQKTLFQNILRMFEINPTLYLHSNDPIIYRESWSVPRTLIEFGLACVNKVSACKQAQIVLV